MLQANAMPFKVRATTAWIFMSPGGPCNPLFIENEE